MKIALIQLPWDYKDWSKKGIPGLLKQAGKVDLVVFPESMPFKETTTHHEAVAQLEKISQELPELAFICGGYIKDGEVKRNRSYLATKGEVKRWYDKQIRWTRERFEPGESAVSFEWDSKKCIPLICADAGDNLTPRKVKMMAAVLTVGAGPKVPIVISSYGGGLMTDFWQPSLRDWSRGCDAPVVICGIAGVHTALTYTDIKDDVYPFGGGGSGAFWPGGEELQCADEGIVTIDLKKRTMEYKPFGQQNHQP